MKIAKSLETLHKLKFYLPLTIMKPLYLTFILPYLMYGIEACYAAYQNVTDKMVILQMKAIRIVKNVPYLEHTNSLSTELQLLKIDDLFKSQILLYMHKTINGHGDDVLLNKLTLHSQIHSYETRSVNMYVVPRLRKSTSRHSIEYVGVRAWNALPPRDRGMTSIRQFKANIKLMFLEGY